jgi:hydroxyethylthiazole kinase
MENWGESTVETLRNIRAKQPLIHNLTNYVVMNSTANTILAVGASPVMAHALEEVEEMAGYASAVVLNIGTLEPVWVKAMIVAGKAANQKGIPVIFDPVGVGATAYRSRVAEQILSDVDCTIIRGNPSEVFSLAGFQAEIRGVDSLMDSDSITSSAVEISQKLDAVIAVTGIEDIVSDGKKCYGVSGGDAMFRQVTGTGCAASVICACFAAVEPDPVKASVQALAYYGVSGMEAAKQVNGPGSFQVALLDALAGITPSVISSSVSVREMP